jgi:hypothetical protein
MRLRLALVEVGQIITTLWVVYAINPESMSPVVLVLGGIACAVLLVNGIVEK